ncbi:hypothetical protein A6U84_25730 (plasmid) [Agrobacterium sp. 13-2099-1-2]|uniref:hypothetical protein n=1 Tax=Agrobacterium sp. 13-2099-1-2 TaxID=1841651 RepID=UPI0008100BA9|nr:hypothetical protein [Agrobacterium sp. 13-2099-1-2]UZX45543.1 hypothetical protein A6U84_25730 [Agrobacterium sp. 13-2099-1-2]
MKEVDELLAKELYSLNKRKDTGEFHLFLNKRNSKAECVFVENKSICGRMTSSQSSKTLFYCEDDVKAREECAQVGRDVCGTCVSHLYTDYEK